MARKSKLTKELIREAVKILEAGNYTNTACALIGIAEDTWYRWLKEAEKPDATSLKKEFSEAITKATAIAEREYLSVIEKAAGKQWQAAAWYLERKYPEKWGRFQRIEHEFKGGVMVVDSQKEQDQWVALARERASKDASGNGR